MRKEENHAFSENEKLMQNQKIRKSENEKSVQNEKTMHLEKEKNVHNEKSVQNEKIRRQKKKTDILVNQALRKLENKKNNLPTDQSMMEANRGQIARLLAPKIKYLFYEIPKTDQEFLGRVNQYFVEVVENEQIPLWEDFCLNLGTTREEVFHWMTTDCKGKFVSNICKKSKELLASLEATMAATGKVTPVVYIFRSKNFYSMRDQAELVVSNSNAITHKTEEELREKYADIIELDVDDDAVK